MQTKPRVFLREQQCNELNWSDNVHPVLRRIYQSRGISDPEQTENSLNRLLSYESLLGIQQAIELVARHIREQKTILIIGDYDADGATSCALAIRCLKAMGATSVKYLVPNRFEYGYGLTPEIVKVAEHYSPDLLITVDNGIASIDGVNAAKQNGWSVVITDHHLPAEQLPIADAIVNPNQPGDTFPSKNLAGVGVIFYLMAGLRTYLRTQNWFEQQNIREPNMADYLDLVALGTVADVVKLDHNNRILVAQGLARIRAAQTCEGIRALLKVAGRDIQRVTSMDMGFFVGPRLNAAGRLDDMSIGIECLLSDTEREAYDYAHSLDQFNRERRHIEQGMREQAERHLASILTENSSNMPCALCLYDPGFHEGVIGILAGRIKEQLHRPTIVFASGENGTIKGSARSIPGLHIRDTLDRVATGHPELLQKFGGHAMAAGLTIRKDDFTQFTEVFTACVEMMLDDDALQRTIHSDGELAEQDINLELAELLRNAGPWGQGFPEPMFSGTFELVQRRIVGEHHLKMLVRKDQKLIDAIAFRTTDRDWPEDTTHVELVYRLDVNDFNGSRQAQFIVEYVTPV